MYFFALSLSISLLIIRFVLEEMIKYYDLLRKKYEHNRKLLNDNRKSIEIIAKLTNEVDEVMEY